MTWRRTLLALAVALPAAAAGDDLPDSADAPPPPLPGVVLAPAPGTAKDAGPAVAIVADLPDPSWKLCEVKASLLATAPGRSIVADEVTGNLYLGETLDLESDVTVPLPQGTCVVHAKVRLRAAAATDDGVTYFISSDGMLTSTIGFQHEQAGRDQFRHEMLEVADEGTRLHEIFALPDLALRVVMVLSVRPLAGREEADAWSMVREPTAGVMRRFRVEALLREADRYETIEEATLPTMDGREAGLSLTRFTVEGAGGIPTGLPGSPQVKMIVVPGSPASSAKDMGALQSVPADRKFQDRVDALQRSLRSDPTVDLGRKLPGQREMPATPRKVSKAKRKKVDQLRKQQEVRDWAVEQSKKLPSGEDVPEGYQTEELVLTVTPLRSTQTSLQVELRLRGRIKLPREDVITALDLTLIEQMRFGEPLEIGIAELVREDAPLYDYVLRITPES